LSIANQTLSGVRPTINVQMNDLEARRACVDGAAIGARVVVSDRVYVQVPLAPVDRALHGEARVVVHQAVIVCERLVHVTFFSQPRYLQRATAASSLVALLVQ
jgi:hypothetical protein